MSTKLEIGATLPNGATLLGINERGSYFIYLAQVADGEWATWEARKDRPLATYHGHYFRRLSEAATDHAARSATDLL